jgi:hypothetical protein
VDRQDGALIQAGEGAETGRDLPRESALDTLRHGRDAGAIPDVLRAAEAFAAHGDLGLAGQAVAIAERLAGQARDEDALARARAIRADLTATTLAAGRFRIEAF